MVVYHVAGLRHWPHLHSCLPTLQSLSLLVTHFLFKFLLSCFLYRISVTKETILLSPFILKIYPIQSPFPLFITCRNILLYLILLRTFPTPHSYLLTFHSLPSFSLIHKVKHFTSLFLTSRFILTHNIHFFQSNTYFTITVRLLMSTPVSYTHLGGVSNMFLNNG